MEKRTICPGCAKELVDETQTVFIVRGFFYCSEACGKRAYGQ